MVLYKFWDSSEELYVDFIQGELTFFKLDISNTKSYIGKYDVFNGNLYAIYSLNGKNYLYLKNRSLEITNSIIVKADVNWSKEELSSFEVYDSSKLLVKVIYKNIHEGILMPFDVIENWEEVNFGYELETLVKKVHREPEIVLFPNHNKGNLKILENSKNVLEYFKCNKNTKPKVNLKHNSEVENEFTLEIENAPKNVFIIDTIESEEDLMFSKGNWVFVLFAGYSGQDIKMVQSLLEVVEKYPHLNFAFKPYMNDERIQQFTEISVTRKGTPILLNRQNDLATFLSSSFLKKEEIEETLGKI